MPLQTVFDVSEALRMRRWQVPAYTLPANLHETEVPRIVVRDGFGGDLAQLLIRDLQRATARLAKLNRSGSIARRSAFHH